MPSVVQLDDRQITRSNDPKSRKPRSLDSIGEVVRVFELFAFGVRSESERGFFLMEKDRPDLRQMLQELNPSPLETLFAPPKGTPSEA
jgi:hypothetical protein